MSLTARSGRCSQDFESSGQIIEEKISKISGDASVRKYRKGKFLGKGGFARVYQIKNIDTDKNYAAKVIQKSSLTKTRAKQKLMSEIKIHRSLRHENIVSFEHFFEDSENVYILLEICDNQTTNELIKRRKRLTEFETQVYIAQLLSALRYLHKHRVIHRDLKLGNLFLNENMMIKLGDFGLATKLEFEGERKRTICGTPNYIAPEILDGKQGHSYEVDTWSLGVIIYTMLIGKPPFETTDVKTTYRRIRMNSYSFPEHIQISENARNLIHRILNSDPTKRPNLDEVSNHPFFSTNLPKTLPNSTLACPPSSSYMRQFDPQPVCGSHGSQTSRAPSRRFTDSSATLTRQKSLTDTATAAKTERSSDRRVTRFSSTDYVPSPKPVERQPQPDVKPNIKPPATKVSTSIWVKKWVDYSSKYGVGYILSNGYTGVYFNDSTKILSNPNKDIIYYYEKKKNSNDEDMSTYTFTTYPREMQKKVTLLQHFQSYLENEAGKIVAEGDNLSEPIYVKKWLRTRHATMFRLSNKVVQVNFQDNTEIVLSSETKSVSYLNKKGEKLQYSLATALESSNGEMTKRLKYTKDLLSNMLKANTARNESNPLTERNRR